MKAITLTAPYGTLIAVGAKTIETRSWATSYRGPLAIHAGKGLGPVGGRAGLYDLAFSDPDGYFYQALHQANIFCIDDLPRGAIVATCELKSCVSTDWLVEAGGAWDIDTTTQLETDGKGFYAYHTFVSADRGKRWPLTDQERAFGDYSAGRFAWLLSNIRPLVEPIPARGALGLWTWEGAL